jgi:hypothetical protein
MLFMPDISMVEYGMPFGFPIGGASLNIGTSGNEKNVARPVNKHVNTPSG